MEDLREEQEKTQQANTTIPNAIPKNLTEVQFDILVRKLIKIPRYTRRIFILSRYDTKVHHLKSICHDELESQKSPKSYILNLTSYSPRRTKSTNYDKLKITSSIISQASFICFSLITNGGAKRII
ncbi:MAG: hypothetical protein RLZZ337_633 [Bacteroidota bacterium]